MDKLIRGNQLVLGSNNQDKLTEIRAICEPYGLKLIPVGNFTTDEPVEDGNSFEANALIKARAAMHISGLVSISDDSGLSLPALDGRPGVDTKPFTESCGSYEEAAKILLAEIGVSRTPAIFTSVLALVWPNGREEIITGILEGTLAYPGQGEGWGFKPYFTPNGYKETLAQLSLEETNQISHRAQAFKKFLADFVI